MNQQALQQHQLSSAWPAMQADEFQALQDSIFLIGVQNPITLYEGMVIDGWHRYCAATEVGMECPSKELIDTDPVDFVKSQNDARRHVTPSQRAAAIVAIYAWHPSGQMSKSTPGVDLKTSAELAEIAGVHINTITQARSVQAKATLEVKAAVKAGTMSLKKAAETINPPKAKPAPEECDTGCASDEDYSAPDSAEMQANAMADQADAKYIQNILDADNGAHLIHAENKRLHLEVAQLKVARDGYMRELHEYKRITAKVQRENDRLRKSLR